MGSLSRVGLAGAQCAPIVTAHPLALHELGHLSCVKVRIVPIQRPLSGEYGPTKQRRLDVRVRRAPC